MPVVVATAPSTIFIVTAIATATAVTTVCDRHCYHNSSTWASTRTPTVAEVIFSELSCIAPSDSDLALKAVAVDVQLSLSLL